MPVIKIWFDFYSFVLYFTFLQHCKHFVYNLTDVFCLTCPASDFLSKHINLKKCFTWFHEFYDFWQEIEFHLLSFIASQVMKVMVEKLQPEGKDVRFSSRMKAVIWLRTQTVHLNFIAHLMFGFWRQDYVKNHWMAAAGSLSGFGPDRTAALRLLTGCNNIPIFQLESRHPLSCLFSCLSIHVFIYLLVHFD